MSETTLYDVGTPCIELRIYEDGRLLGSELCESEADAAAAVDHWAVREGVTFLVDDLTNRHGPDDVLSPEPALSESEIEEDYPIATAPVPPHGAE